MLRVMRGQGDQWDKRARVRGITASFSLNGIGLVPEDSPDLYQENEELKVCFPFRRQNLFFPRNNNRFITSLFLNSKTGGNSKARRTN